MSILRKLILSVVLSILLISATAAQDSPQTIELGQTLTVTVSEPTVASNDPSAPPTTILGPTLTFTLAEPTYITILATSNEADPIWVLSQNGREVLRIYDNPFSLNATRPNDAALDDSLLFEGDYQLTVGRSDQNNTPASVEVSLKRGTSDFLGVGQVERINGTVSKGEQYIHLLDLQEGEVLSVSALTDGISGFDSQLELRRPDGSILSFNDDHTTLEFWLTDLDPKLNQIIIRETGRYSLIVRGYTDGMGGDFTLVFQRYGMIDSSAETVEELRGTVNDRVRTALTFEGRAGEFVQVAVNSVNGLLDSQLVLLDPENRLIAQNDDHNSETGGLYPYDALISTILLESDGAYTAEVSSLAGRDEFRLVIQRVGTLNRAATVSPIDPTAWTVAPYEASPAASQSGQIQP